jgi:hypothetical protein
LGVERIPEAEQMVAQQIRQYERQTAQAGLRMRITGDLGKVRLEHSVNGASAEEWITALTFASGTPGPTYNVMTGGMGHGLRAPKGELDAKTYSSPRCSLPCARIRNGRRASTR